MLVTCLSTCARLAATVDVGQAVGPVKLTTWFGATLEMNNYRERPATALLFLSSRCSTTRAATAEINKIYLKFRLRDVLFVGVFPNPDESLDEVRTFSQRSGMIYPTYRDLLEGSYFLSLAKGATSWHREGFTSGGSQPAVVERSDSSLLALLRHARMITQITSRDSGAAWSSAEPTTLQNPDSGISMTKLASGHLVLVYNDSQTRRTPLSIVRSRDEGKSWEKPLHLESNPGDYSYPCVIQSADGKIHVTYTFRRYSIKHVALNEDWFDHDERPD